MQNKEPNLKKYIYLKRILNPIKNLFSSSSCKTSNFYSVENLSQLLNVHNLEN